MTDPTMQGVVEPELRRLAEAATPGPWASDEGRPYNSGLDPIDEGEWPSFSIPSPDPNSGREWWTHSVFSDNPNADAAYIAAASPDVILALLEAAERMRLRAIEAETRLAEARAVATIWRDDYLRFIRESPDTPWAIGTHPLALVLAALDGETDAVHLGVDADRLAAALSSEQEPRP